MKRLRAVVLTTVVLAVVLVTLPVGAMPKKGTIAPSFAARDIHEYLSDDGPAPPWNAAHAS